ncbi:MAG TPA: hypothetical protein VJZ71_14610 [Phycisphaerae bacterium]|nr:hypothetical protein [Phycisphaerae bacterium]
MPDTIAELCEAVEKSDSKSSLFKKADAELRAKLVEALIRKNPWTYHDCFQHFELDRLGISFTAFYYWARRVRRSAALIEMARSCDAEQDPVELVPRVLAFRLLDASLDDDAGLTALNRLTRIYQAASNVEIARRRMENASQKADAAKTRSENNDLSRLCKIAAHLQRKDLRAESEKLREGEAPAEPLPDISNPPAPTVPNPVHRNPVASVASPSPIPHSAFPLPHSLPDPLAPRLDLADLPDPDPRREALRRRILADFDPGAFLNSS